MVVMDVNQTMTSKACELCQSLVFFSNQHGLAFVEIDLGDHCMTLEVRGRFFKKWLQHNFYKAYAKPISETVMSEALFFLEAKALFEGGKKETYLRTAYVNGKIYVDLGRDFWEVVEIDSNGYQILNRSPVAFIRKEGMAAMPIPRGNGLLRNFLHINVSENQLKLILAWILGVFRGKPPYPILIISGEQGSGKSTLTEILRRIVDPSVVPLRGISTTSDLVITAASSLLIVMDNVSKITPEISDLLCRISTGGGYAKRILYSDADEIFFDLKNPIIINRITSQVDRPDLLDRALLIEVRALDHRQTHAEVMQGFEEQLPQILGSIFTVLSGALRELPMIQSDELPRMADFATFIMAAEGSLGWEPGTILACMADNQNDLARDSIDGHPFVSAMVDYLDMRSSSFEGTCAELLSCINGFGLDNASKSKGMGWPQTPHGVGNLLDRFEPYLKRLGYKFTRKRSSDRGRRRIIRFSKEDRYLEK